MGISYDKRRDRWRAYCTDREAGKVVNLGRHRTREDAEEALSRYEQEHLTGRRPLAQRFWSNVARGEGCWEWQAARTETGYGQFWNGEMMEAAHRIAWSFVHGSAGDKYVLHHCDNPPCVRPDHLYIGTQVENMRDVVERERGWWHNGRRSPTAKLTDSQALEIRARFDAGEPRTEIAKAFSVSISVVERIGARVTYQDLSES